jgi:hypothetical protein
MSRDIEQAIRKISKEERISLNKVVLRLLEKALGKPGPGEYPEPHDDLDRFCGVWSQEEAEELESGLSRTRSVDNELWE